MPANLPPQYYEAERVFREVKTIPEKITAIEDMMAIMPKHKGTDHLRAELRAKIAKLTQQAGKKSTLHRTSMVIVRESAGQVAVIGVPNVGKSQLINSVTNASLLVADYPFTTQTATPAMMPFENIQVQLIDTPPVAPQIAELLMPHMLRRADALITVIDLSNAPLEQMSTIIKELWKMGIGIGIGTGEEKALISEKPALIVGNKLDLDAGGKNYALLQNKYRKLPMVAVNAKDAVGLEEMKQSIYRLFDIIRVYTKAPGQKPEFEDPVILKRGSTLEDAAAGVHKDFAANLKYARL